MRCRRDSVEQTVNYLTVYEVVSLQMRITQRMIERVAMNIIEVTYASFRQVRHVKCTVRKSGAPARRQTGEGERRIEK